MTMREKIKEAIGNGPNYERDADAIVGAVLDAMREPTPEIIAVMTNCERYGDMTKIEAWRAMIDVAKGEAK